MLSNKPVTAIVAVTDLERARRFYCTTLGLELEQEMGGGLLLKAGGGTKLFAYERPAGPQAGHTEATFMVDDIEREVDELRSRGITFEEYDMPGLKTERGIATMGESKSAWFKDPDENILAITMIAA